MSARQRRKTAKRRRHAPAHKGTRRRIVAGAGLGVAAALGAGTTAHAADFTVNAGDDAGDGTCDSAPGGCTLRDALDDAAANDNSPTVDQILFDSSVTGTITLNGTQLPTIDEPLYIDGPGAGTLEISGDDVTRILLVETELGDDVTVSGLTLSAGYGFGSPPLGPGGAISNFQADLTIDRVTIAGGSASSGGAVYSTSGEITVQNSTISGNGANSGGGVFSSGEITVNDSKISGNKTFGSGGGLWSSGPTTIQTSTISGNAADGAGGGVYSRVSSSSGEMTVKDSTISGNSGGGLETRGADVLIQTSTISGNSGGGVALQGIVGKYGVYAQGAATIRDSTVSGNSGIGVSAAFQERNPTVANTIVADNTGPDLSSPSGTGGETFKAAFSLIEHPAGAPIINTTPGSNITGVDPQLGPLTDNGGPTATQAIPETSAAVDQGSSELNSDQRGMLRAVNLPSAGESDVFGANCADIGAFELQLPDGGAGPECHSDLTPPETEITDGPKDKKHNKKATFAFTSSEPGSSFECKVDDGSFEPCSSPQGVQVKGKGKHSFEVRAIDAAGNADPTPAADDWKVKKKKK